MSFFRSIIVCGGRRRSSLSRCRRELARSRPPRTTVVARTPSVSAAAARRGVRARGGDRLCPSLFLLPRYAESCFVRRFTTQEARARDDCTRRSVTAGAIQHLNIIVLVLRTYVGAAAARATADIRRLQLSGISRHDAARAFHKFLGVKLHTLSSSSSVVAAAAQRR